MRRVTNTHSAACQQGNVGVKHGTQFQIITEWKKVALTRVHMMLSCGLTSPMGKVLLSCLPYHRRMKILAYAPTIQHGKPTNRRHDLMSPSHVSPVID